MAETTELTLDLVRERADLVVAADRTDGDPESAHGDQDALYEDVLRAVAAGHRDSAAMAREVLRISENENRTRWYA